jgi:hypothetical protein
MDIKKRIDEMELLIKEMETNIHLDKINKEQLMRDNKRGGSGDVNNDGFVTEGDSKQILDFLVGKGNLDDTNKINAKVTSENEKLGLEDIITIQREINNLSNEVNNIIPVSLVGKSLEVKDLSGERLDFKEIMAKKLKVRNRDISIDIQDLSRNLQQLKKLDGRDASFNYIITRNLDVSGGGALRVNGTNVLRKFQDLDVSINAIDRNILDLSSIRQQYKEADAKILQDVSDVSGAVEQIKRQIKDLDDTVNILKDSVDTMQNQLLQFLIDDY